MKNLKRIILICILIVILVFVIIFIRRFYIINRILNKMDENTKVINFFEHSKGYDTENGNVISEATMARKDNVCILNSRILKAKVNNVNQDIGVDVTLYYNNDEGVAYSLRNKTKEIEKIEGKGFVLGFINDSFYGELVAEERIGFKDKLKACFDWKIKTDEVEGKKCYYIVRDGKEYWIDKEKCYTRKCFTDDGIVIIDIKFDGVTDEDVKLPDLTGYTEVKQDSNL